MADRIICQGPGYTIAESDKASGMVPYHAVVRANGDQNHGFIDIRDRPELVSLIPELQKSDGFAELVRSVNEPGSPFMTLGCECGLFPVENAREGEPTCYVGSYASVTFRDPEMNSQRCLYDLAAALLRGTEPTEDHIVAYTMVIEPLKTFFGSDGCFSLCLKPLGYGHSAAEAWAAFDYATRAVARAVRKVDASKLGSDGTIYSRSGKELAPETS